MLLKKYTGALTIIILKITLIHNSAFIIVLFVSAG